jgi:hypothetical protein
MVTSWSAATCSLTALQWWITHVFRSPLRFGLDLHQNSAYVAHFISSFRDRNFWYRFFWLLPLSLVRLRRLPRNWRVATAVTSVTAFALDAYYGGAPGTIGRALFSIAGPLLCASVALLLFTDVNTEPRVRMPTNRRRDLLSPTMRILSRPTSFPVGRLLKSLDFGNLPEGIPPAGN